MSQTVASVPLLFQWFTMALGDSVRQGCDNNYRGVFHIADENEHVKNLEKALGSLIERRRQIAIGLSEPFKRGRTENLQERFNVVQTTIEAVRKAI